MTAPVYLDCPAGTDRTGDPLLSFSDEAQALRALVMESQWFLSYVGGIPAAPIAKAWSERQRHPRPGDLVYVNDVAIGSRYPADSRFKGFGYFILLRMEPCYTEAEWAEVADQYEGRPCPTEDVFYIQYGPDAGDVCRWENATCRVIATDGATREVRR